MKILEFDREHLLHYLRENVFSANEALNIAEIGVFQGGFARSIFDAFPDCKIHLVDMWKTEGNDFYYSNKSGTPEDVELAFYQAKERFSGESPHRVNFIVSKSKDASELFSDESLDFVYIDADHSYEGVLSDLQAWYPKVKTGGIIAGHDWDCYPFHGDYHKFGIQPALREFFKERLENVMLTNEQYHKSWALLKE